ncbi:fasciclin domain-containing protein [Chitinophaga lutea]
MQYLRRYITSAVLVASLGFAACGDLPLQPGYDYNQSFYESDLKMNAWDFMNSRKDVFSGMIAAVEYVDTDAEFKDIKQALTQPGYTFLLLSNDATVDLEIASSYWSMNTFPNAADPLAPIKGTAWQQYTKKQIAEMLRYHILKGRFDYSNLNSNPVWAGTIASGDTAKVYIYMQASREGYIFFNNYLVNPNAAYKEVRPRTPNLQATNGPVHVMNRFLVPPTKDQVATNK